MTTAPRRPLNQRNPYANLAEADAVIKLALEMKQPEEGIYERVKAKAKAWDLSTIETAQRLYLAERAQLAPEW